MLAIAVEEHYRAPTLARMIAGESEGVFAGTPFGRAFAKLDDLGAGRLTDMDGNGIAMQVLSHGYPGTETLGAANAIPAARDANDYVAAAVRGNPTRYAAFATLPTADPQAAAAELERCVADLGMVGALINGQTDGRFLSDHRFWPIFECAEALGVPVYLHPGEPPAAVQGAYYSDLPPQTARALTLSAWGWHMELGLHALRLILGGVCDRFPRLQFVLGHMGEFVPYMLTRTSGELALAGDLPISRRLEEYFASNFHFTTSGVFTYPPLQCLLSVVGTDRVMFAVDYPFCDNQRGREFLDGVPISVADKGKIAYGNAARLLGLPEPL